MADERRWIRCDSEGRVSGIAPSADPRRSHPGPIGEPLVAAGEKLTEEQVVVNLALVLDRLELAGSSRQNRLRAGPMLGLLEFTNQRQDLVIQATNMVGSPFSSQRREQVIDEPGMLEGSASSV